MPDDMMVMHAKVEGVEASGFLVETQLQVLGNRARLGAVIERHHEDGDEHHGRDGADPVEVAGHHAVLGTGCGHAHDLLGAQVG